MICRRAPVCGTSANFSSIITFNKENIMSYQYVNVVIIQKVAVIEFNYARKLNAS
ncbi:hypothetical protein ACNKHK_18585 [Shigella flexneri]